MVGRVIDLVELRPAILVQILLHLFVQRPSKSVKKAQKIVPVSGAFSASKMPQTQWGCGFHLAPEEGFEPPT